MIFLTIDLRKMNSNTLEKNKHLLIEDINDKAKQQK
jgi:hypothetical protein